MEDLILIMFFRNNFDYSNEYKESFTSLASEIKDDDCDYSYDVLSDSNYTSAEDYDILYFSNVQDLAIIDNDDELKKNNQTKREILNNKDNSKTQSRILLEIEHNICTQTIISKIPLEIEHNICTQTIISKNIFKEEKEEYNNNDFNLIIYDSDNDYEEVDDYSITTIPLKF